MKTGIQIKRILSIATLTLLSTMSQSWAAGGVGTGGGNLIHLKPPHKPYSGEVEKLIRAVRPVARMELNQLRDYSFGCGAADSDTNYKCQLFMTARQKFLSNPDETRKIIDSVNIEILTDKACDVIEDNIVQHKAASATLPNDICFSLSEIGKYDVSSDDPTHLPRMIRGLFFHELTHLVAGIEAEAEAQAMQEIMTGRLLNNNNSFDAIYKIQSQTRALTESLQYFDQLLSDFSSGRITELAVCSRMPKLLYGMISEPRFNLTEQESWSITRVIVRLDLVSSGYCEANDLYKSYFADKTAISELDLHVQILKKNNLDPSTTPSELARLRRFTSPTVFFNNLIPRSEKTLIKELSAARNDLLKVIQALQAMEKL